MDELKRLLSAPLSPAAGRFLKQAGKGINRFSMIPEGERILLGVSGGKDSLAMAFALWARKRWVPVPYDLEGLVVDWTDFPLSPAAKSELAGFFDLMGVPLTILEAPMPVDTARGEHSCYACARKRKQLLFEAARERGIGTVALGHHMDDIVETTLINLALNGKIETMAPVQGFFNGEMRVIRPLCEVRESTVARVAEKMSLPVVSIPCPYREDSLRARMKPIVRQLSHINRHAREHIYEASMSWGGGRRSPDACVKEDSGIQ